MRTVRDIAWLAGLIEGEGSFGFKKGCPRIEIQMTDADVVSRAASVLGVKPRAPWIRKDGYKPVWACCAFGSRAIGWMMTLLPLLGERRRARIAEIVSLWRNAPNIPKAQKGEHYMASCHPDRPRRGRGLCSSCYMSAWRKQKRGVVMQRFYTAATTITLV